VNRSCNKGECRFDITDSEAHLVKWSHIDGENTPSDRDAKMPPIMHYKRSRNGGPHSAISGQSVDGVPSKENKTETSCGKRAGECSRRYSEKSGPRMIDNRQRTLTTHNGNKFQDKDFVYDTTTNKQYSIGQRRYSDPRLQLDNKMVRSLIRHVIALIALVVLLLAVLTVGGGVLMWKVVQLSDEMLKAGIESQNLSLHSNLTLSPLDPTGTFSRKADLIRFDIFLSIK